MKRPVFIIAAIILICAISCSKHRTAPLPNPERELSIPEKVEKEIMDILSKDWTSLSDTLSYFDSTMLSKGKFKGRGPDGVYYDLNLRLIPHLKASFRIEDSTWAEVEGKTIPFEMKLSALGAEMVIKKEKKDSISLSVAKIKVTAPSGFLSVSGKTSSLFYEGQSAGYLTREDFENTDYSTGTYIIIHYYNDNRTFAIYDGGLGNLLKMSLKNVFE